MGETIRTDMVVEFNPGMTVAQSVRFKPDEVTPDIPAETLERIALKVVRADLGDPEWEPLGWALWKEQLVESQGKTVRLWMGGDSTGTFD